MQYLFNIVSCSVEDFPLDPEEPVSVLSVLPFSGVVGVEPPCKYRRQDK